MEEKIFALLQEKIPEIDFRASDTLVEDGILDSLTITTIIAEISMEFGILIPVEQINEENFNSVAAMAELVESLQD